MWPGVTANTHRQGKAFKTLSEHRHKQCGIAGWQRNRSIEQISGANSTQEYPWLKKKKKKEKFKAESESKRVMNRDRPLRRRLKIRIKGHILCVPSGENTLETTLTV